MLSFVLIYNKSDKKIENYIDKSVLKKGSELIYIDDTSAKNMLTTEHNVGDKITLYTYTNDNAFFKKENYLYKNEEGLYFHNGWILKNNKIETDIKNLTDVSLESEMTGHYTFCHLNSEGEGFLRRDKIASNMIFYYEDDDIQIYSENMALIFQSIKKLSKKGIKNCLSDDFIKRRLLIAHTTVGYYTFIEGIKLLKLHTHLSITKNGISIIEQEDSFYDQEIYDLYRKDKKKFYDDIYKKILVIVDYIANESDSIKLSLSGGKDSRLVLAMLSTNEKALSKLSLFSRGSADNPDVKTAQLLAKEFNLPQSLAWAEDRTETQVDESLVFAPSQLFDFYGFNSFYTMYRKPRVSSFYGDKKESYLEGQASYRGEEDIVSKMKIVKYKLKEQYWKELLEIEELQADKNKDNPNWLLLQCVDVRHAKFLGSCYIANTKKNLNMSLFFNDLTLKYAYALPPEVREKDEFIYEIMKRANEKLVSLPFAQQTWNGLEGAPKTPPITWSDSATKSVYSDNISYRFGQKHYKKFKKTILKYSSKQILDKVDIKSFKSKEYNVFQPIYLLDFYALTILSNINSFYELRYLKKRQINGVPLVFKETQLDKIYKKIDSKLKRIYQKLSEIKILKIIYHKFAKIKILKSIDNKLRKIYKKLTK